MDLFPKSITDNTSVANYMEMEFAGVKFTRVHHRCYFP